MEIIYIKGERIWIRILDWRICFVELNSLSNSMHFMSTTLFSFTAQSILWWNFWTGAQSWVKKRGKNQLHVEKDLITRWCGIDRGFSYQQLYDTHLYVHALTATSAGIGAHPQKVETCAENSLFCMMYPPGLANQPSELLIKIMKWSNFAY